MRAGQASDSINAAASAGQPFDPSKESAGQTDTIVSGVMFGVAGAGGVGCSGSVDAYAYASACGGAIYGPCGPNKCCSLSSGSSVTVGGINAVFYPDGASFADADLREADLSRAVVARADLRGARLDGAKLEGANLGAARLERATGERPSFIGALLAKATLTSAALRGGSFGEADLFAAVLAGADLSGAVAPKLLLMKLDLSGVKLAGADLSGATFLESRFDATDFGGASIRHM